MADNEIRDFLLESLKPSRLNDARNGLPSALFDQLEAFGDREEETWEFLIEYSMRLHALAPFLTLVSRSSRFPELPAPVRGKIETLLRQERMRLALLDELLEESLGLLQAGQIPVIVLKGMDLGRHHYPERILRPMTDVDLLVPSDRFRDAIQTLLAAGFRMIGPFPEGRFRVELGREPGGPVVELHHLLQQGDTEESIQGIWGRAKPAASDPSMRTLDPNDFLAYLIRHAGQQHLLESPGWLSDLHFLITSPDFRSQGNWEALLRELRQNQAFSAGYFLLWFLAREWDTLIPPEILAQVEREIPSWKRSLLRDRACPERCFPAAGRTLPWVISSRLLLRDTPWMALQYALGAIRRHSWKQANKSL